MSKDYDFNNKDSTESFHCPYCGGVFKKPKLVVMYYYYRGKPLRLHCPYCNTSWWCDIMIKRYYQFEEHLNTRVEVNDEIYYNP